MSEQIKSFIKQNKPQFNKYGQYIKDNDWQLKGNGGEEKTKAGKPKSDVQLKSEEFKVQNALIKTILDRTKFFVNKNKGDQHLKIFKDFIKWTLTIVKTHTDRVDSYIYTSDVTEIKDIDLRTEEIAFHNDLFKEVSSIQDTITALNIQEDATETSGIEFLNNAKAPLSMHSIICKLYPEVERKLKELKIDFDTPPKPELHIHNPNPPKWNIEKHYWEQEPKTLQYYVDEFKKIRGGITIDGYYFSPWMYYHMNVYVTPVPEIVVNPHTGERESKDIIKNPPLRDNEVYIFDSYNKAKKEEKMMFLAATRRAAKTTLLASHLDHAATIGLQELLCAGGSSKDLGQIAKNFKISVTHKNPAFSIYNISNDWKDKIEIGIKSKSNKTILLSTLNIVNLDAGGDRKSELLAGFTPSIFILDEVMKAPFIDQLSALKPALGGADGKKRCYPILSGTGGNESLSKDALEVLNFPDQNDILSMDWGLLERGMNPEDITWEEDKLKDFGTFLPGQMSVTMPKYDSTLGQYLNKDKDSELNKVKLRITDWRGALEAITKERDKKLGNKSLYTKEVVYIPIKPSEIFMSGKENPFPVEEAKAHKQYLLETGKWDRRRTMYRDSSGRIQIELTTKDLAPFPHKGGNIDAPFLIFEEPPTDKPKWGTYCSGFDAYKQENSDSNSVGTFYVWKNDVIGDPFSKKLVASISFKPEKQYKMYEAWLMLMEAYNLEGTCFGENEDYAIKDYLDKRHLADKYLAQSLDFTQTFNLPNNLKRKTGWSPQTSKKTLFNLFVDYCNETFEVEDDEGNILTLKGVQRIDDIGLLDEIIAWSENTNVDRITAAMGAVGYMHYLNSSYKWRPTQYKRERNDSMSEEPRKLRTKSFYSMPARSRGFYRR